MFKRMFSFAFLVCILSLFAQPLTGNAISVQKVSNERESNNTLVTANSVQPNSEIKGLLADETDIDFYKFVLPYKGNLSLYSYLGNTEDDNYYYSNEYDMKLYTETGDELEIGEFFNDDDDVYWNIIDPTLEKGVYYLSIQGADYSDLENQSYSIFMDVEFEPDFTIDALTANLASPQEEQTTIKFETKSKTENLEYQYSIDEEIVQRFSKTNTYTWEAGEPGTYSIKVEVRNPEYPDAVIEKEIAYKINAYKPDFKITSITTDTKAPFILGKTIKLAASSDKANLQYQFKINNKVVQKFSTTKTYNWKPEKAGKNIVKVEARRIDFPNSIVTKEVNYTIIDGKVTISSLKASLSSPRPTTATIKWTAKAKGVNLSYQFSVYQNKKWVTVQKYSSKSYTNWKPKKSGKYKMKVTVKSKASGKTATKQSGNYTIFQPSAFSITSFKANKTSPKTTGTSIYFKAAGKGSYLEYRFRVYNGDYWYTAQDYSSTKTYYGSPYYTGTYKVKVDVRQKGTKTVKSKTISYKIKESPNYYMNSDYSISSNYGYLKVTNYGYSNIKVTKLELVNDYKVIYKYSPKDWIIIGRQYDTFYFYPKKAVTSFNYYTSVKVTYTYDGIKYIKYLYR